MKRRFQYMEMVFDVLYLVAAYTIGAVLVFTSLISNIGFMAGIMALVLAFGDSFHLIPRVLSCLFNDKQKYVKSLGRGKQIASITMTIFYILLWHIGLDLQGVSAGFFTIIIYLLSAVRIILCLMPQNKWTQPNASSKWGIYRNIPFFLIGIIVSTMYFMFFSSITHLNLIWILILFSFAFYLPVVLFSGKNPKFGMLMLPKTCAYIWMLSIFLP